MRFWLGDGLVDETEARVNVLDRGFLIGDAVFDTTTVVRDGRGEFVPFALDRHLRRLMDNAREIGLDLPADRVTEALLAVCSGNPDLAPGASIRVTVTTGEGPPVSRPQAAGALVVVVIRPTSEPPPAAITAAISPWPVAAGSALAGIKSTSFGGCARALRWAASVGADEAILGSTSGDVVEGSTSNVFAVLDGRLVTPDLARGGLPGVTRALVIKWCVEAGMRVDEETVPISRLHHADEVLVSNSLRGVQRVVALLDTRGETIWASEKGQLGERVQRIYRERAALDPNP